MAHGVLPLLLLVERPIQPGNLGRDSRPAQKAKKDLTWVLRANLQKKPFKKVLQTNALVRSISEVTLNFLQDDTRLSPNFVSYMGRFS